jgi:hypothetical protein
LARLTNLRYLCLRSTAVEDLGPLTSLPELARLDLIDCAGIHDLSPLMHLPQLECVWIRDPATVDLGSFDAKRTTKEQERADRCMLGRSFAQSVLTSQHSILELRPRRTRRKPGPD